jgi:hypothetical protein
MHVTVCAGALGNTKVVVKLTSKLIPFLKTEEQLHKIISHRVVLLGKQPPSYFRLMIYELLYLWNDLPSTKNTQAIIRGKIYNLKILY